MPFSSRKHGSIASVAIALAVLGGAAALAAKSSETPFLAENATAMNKMMSAMTIKPTGNVDKDFVDMMVPHHQGAIDMAVAYLRYGHNEQLRRIAQEIIVSQQQEIPAMRLAVGEPLPPSAPSPTQGSAAPGGGQTSTPSGTMQMPSGMNMKVK
jgi:hypothetical protein